MSVSLYGISSLKRDFYHVSGPDVSSQVIYKTPGLKYIHESDRPPQHLEIVVIGAGSRIGGKFAPLCTLYGDPRRNGDVLNSTCLCFAALTHYQIPTWTHTCMSLPQVE
jgi:hypothetical protein